MPTRLAISRRAHRCSRHANTLRRLQDLGGGRGAAWPILRFSDEPHNKAVAAPNFYIVILHELFGRGDRFAIVATDERFKSIGVPVCVNDISPIFLHQVQSKGRSSLLKELGDFLRP
jgi:hypothetical protein